jgi:carbamoyltransferase
MITEPGKITGVPAVLKTSFNVMREPVVESPLQGTRCFFSTELDALVTGGCLLCKDNVLTTGTW